MARCAQFVSPAMSGSCIRATTCYMAEGSERGVAYDFWVRVKDALADKGWTDTELHQRTGVARSTVNNLKTATRVSRRTVNKLAQALGIDSEEAWRLAGITPAGRGSRGDGVRAAIQKDPNYDDYQREAMLAFVDLIEQGRPVPGAAADQEVERDRKAG